MANKETFCNYPFESLFLETSGNVKPCCSLKVPLGNIKDNSLKEIMEGELATDIRASITEGKWHSAGLACKLADSKGMVAKRNGHSLKEYDRMKDIINEEHIKFNDKEDT